MSNELKLKPCPFCGGEVVIQIRDDEGNLHNEKGYEENPWSGLSYTIGHYHEDNEGCPIASYKEDEGQMGVYLYDTREDAIEAWNRRTGGCGKMLNKEESLKKAKELSYGWHVGDNEFVPLKDVNKLIRETYSSFNKEIEYFKQLEKNYDDLYEEVHNPQPYKFEDLKYGLWVWDEKNKMCLRICKTKENENIKDLIVVGGNQYWIENFEENRFYPVQMANVGCE